MSAAMVSTLYDPQTGILKSKGQDALKASQDGIDNLKKKCNEIVGGLNGEAQKGLASQMAIGMVDNANRAAMAHADQQMTAFHTEAMHSTVKNFSAAAALGHGDPKTVADSIKHVNDATESYITSERLDKQSADDLRAKNKDMVYFSTAEGLMKHTTGSEAQDFFNANKDQISPETRVKISDMLKENGLTNQALALTNKYWTGSKQDFSAAYDKTNSIQDLALQKRVREELKGLQADKNERFQSHQMDLFQNGMRSIQDAQQRGGKDPFDKVVGPMLSTQLEPAKYDALKKMYMNSETGSQKWTDFNLMKPDEMRAISKDELQTDWLPNFSPKDREKAMSMYQRAQGNSVDAYVTHDQNATIKEYAQQMGVAGLTAGHDPAKLKGDRAKAWMDYLNSSQQAITNFEATKLQGVRKATDEETKAVMDGIHVKMLGQHSIGPFNWGGKAVYESQYSTPFEEIPDSAKSDLTVYAQRIGVKATPEQIQRAYFHYQKKDVQGVREAFQ